MGIIIKKICLFQKIKCFFGKHSYDFIEYHRLVHGLMDSYKKNYTTTHIEVCYCGKVKEKKD